MRRAVDRWVPSALLTATSVTLLVTGWSELATVVVAGLLLLLAWGFSPMFFPPSREDGAAQEQASTREVPLIYWRPGCVYCLRLRLALGRRGNRAVWVDVSQDAGASARVREVNHGNETVPTVFVGTSASVNPAPAWVRSQLS